MRILARRLYPLLLVDLHDARAIPALTLGASTRWPRASSTASRPS
jgi:hypothetical protein